MRIVMFVTTLAMMLLASGCNLFTEKKPKTNIANVDTTKTEVEYKKQVADTLTLFESLLEKRGTLTVVDKYSIGEKLFRGARPLPENKFGASIIRVDVIVVQDFGNAALKLRGLRIGTGTSFDYRRDKNFGPEISCNIYFSEIPTVLSMIDSIQALRQRWSVTTREDSRATFATHGKFEITLMQDKERQLLFLGCGDTKAYLTCYVNNEEELVAIKSLITAGYERARSL